MFLLFFRFMGKHWTIIHHNPAYRQQRLSKCVLIALTSTAHFLICSTNWMCIKFSEHFIIFFPRNWSHVLAHIFLRLDIFVTPWQSQSVKERKHHITYNLISILSVVRKFSHSFHLKSYVVKHRSTYGCLPELLTGIHSFPCPRHRYPRNIFVKRNSVL